MRGGLGRGRSRGLLEERCERACNTREHMHDFGPCHHFCRSAPLTDPYLNRRFYKHATSRASSTLSSSWVSGVVARMARIALRCPIGHNSTGIEKRCSRIRWTIGQRIDSLEWSSSWQRTLIYNTISLLICRMQNVGERVEVRGGIEIESDITSTKFGPGLIASSLK